MTNHDIYRPTVKGSPFSCQLVTNRSSLGWLNTMEARYYLYPVHTSKTFLLPRTLASSLYLILIRLMHREYDNALRLCESCHVDVDFTSEESWIFSQFERTMTDCHPDAHAVRLKLSLAVMYSNNSLPWELHQEVDLYLSKLARVSQCCILSAEEELDSLIRSKIATPRIKNRLTLLRSTEGLSVSPNASSSEVVLSGAVPRIGGRPWTKLCNLGLDYVEVHASSLTSVSYKPPEGVTQENPVLSDQYCLSILWNDLLIMDEESGVNRQLGFLFLYLVSRGQLPLSIDGVDVSRSMGELLTRWLHLRKARWGRETTGDDETEALSSKQMSILAALFAHSHREWPMVPMDSSTMSQLARTGGVQLYSTQGRTTMIKEFIDFVDVTLRDIMSSSDHNDLIDGQRAAVHDAAAYHHSKAGTVSVRVELQRQQARVRPRASNCSCSERTLKSFDLSDTSSEEKTDSEVSDGQFRDLQHIMRVSAVDVMAFASMPLSPLDLDRFIRWESKTRIVRDSLPFDLSRHPSAQSAVGKDLLHRIKEDVSGYAASCRKEKIPKLKFLSADLIEAFTADTSHSGIKDVIDSLEELVAHLHQLQRQDGIHVESTIRAVHAAANCIPLCQRTSAALVNASETSVLTSKARLALSRLAGHSALLSMETLTGMVISSTACEDITCLNPHAQSVPELLNAMTAMLLRTSRICLANRVVSHARALQASLRRLPHSKHLQTAQELNHASNTIALALTSRRHFLHVRSGAAGTEVTFDPRFLLFEYIFDIMLRRRQVEMVNSFARQMRDGDASVQQMIMGAGKTTVVGPLLVLLLADGEHLVVQTMPTALLEQSRNVLRSRFSVIIPKSVYTLQFDRSCDDGGELILEIFAKLNGARRHRSVVCAAPETIKSLMLKFIEQLHSLQGLNHETLTPGQSSRNNKEVVRIRQQMIARSDMADAIVRVLQMWHRGYLIMDEVDVLLHPLRSELNFPIGHKTAIDLSGHRWDFPIHLLDAIFVAHSQLMSSQRRGKGRPVLSYCSSASGHADLSEAEGADVEIVLGQIQEALQEGFESKRLQSSPHLVLLDDGFYHVRLQPIMAKWALMWLKRQFVGRICDGVSEKILLEYLCGQNIEINRSTIDTGLRGESIKLLNLASNWIRNLLPHVLSKIDRVSYGILNSADMVMVDPRAPQSRLLMSVPFVGKDVPSRSSEFAHPDVLIGLTILAYRYEGVRMSDLKRLVFQLKQDYSRQVGPQDQRPASLLFSRWISEAELYFHGRSGERAPSVLPLPLFQPADRKQMNALFTLVRHLPAVAHYYLCQHVFPACMNFQELKVSACGHELGSDILFAKRIGFSGTPSNLLPVDLGQCQYEPGSDGKIVDVLTSSEVTTASIKSNWTARSLLRDVASAVPPVHALIDTGALITGLDNEEVARYLLQHLPQWMEGVVFLDRLDRQMILLRDSHHCMNLAQCGISPERRFTFYDQVHTTGMDIKQAPNARAVLTIGKDMTFRDYAQGAFRMRNIGTGQTIHLYIISEVLSLMQEQLVLPVDWTNEQTLSKSTGGISIISGCPEIDVPAWLLLNSLRTEGLQFVQLSVQELNNVWRKHALRCLRREVEVNQQQKGYSGMQRMRRFVAEEVDDREMQLDIAEGIEPEWLAACIDLFREPISYAVEDRVPVGRSFSERIVEMVAEKRKFMRDEGAKERVGEVASMVKQTTDQQAQTGEISLGFAREVRIAF